MRRYAAFLVALLVGASLAWAAATTLSPPAIIWGGGSVQTPAPVAIIGYDSSSGVPCIVGSTSTCPFTGSGASITITGYTTTDGSTTLATGGTAQNLFSGTTPPHGFEVCSPDGSNPLWISDSTTAVANGTGSHIASAGGGCYITPQWSKPIGAVSVVGASSSQKITARYW